MENPMENPRFFHKNEAWGSNQYIRFFVSFQWKVGSFSAMECHGWILCQAVYVPADDLTDPAPVRCSVAQVFHFFGEFYLHRWGCSTGFCCFFVKLMACLFVGRKKTTSPDSRRGHHVRTLGCNDGPRPMKPGKWWSKMAIGWNCVACFQTKSWFHWWDFGGYIMLNRLNKYQGSKHIRDLKYD